MRLQVVSSNSTYYWSVTNAVPAKPYLPIASGANTYYIPLTTATRAGIKLKVQSGNTTYRAAVYESGYYNTTSAAVGNLSSTTALTRASTSATLTRASTSATLTRASTSATLTRASTSATLTRASTSATYTRSSISGYGTRSSISGYATSASRVNYNTTVFTRTTSCIETKAGYSNIYTRNLYIDREYQASFTYSYYSTAGGKISGHVILEKDVSWNPGAYRTTNGNNFDRSSYSFTHTNGDYPTMYGITAYYATSMRPLMYVWQTLVSNSNSTKSFTSDCGNQPWGNTSWLWNAANLSGSSSSRYHSWTNWDWGNESTATKNTILKQGTATSASLFIFGNIFSTRMTGVRSVNMPNAFHQYSYGGWITVTYTEIHHIQYMEARVADVVATYSTKAVTTATLTRASTSATYTRASASAYGTRSSISGYATRSSISGYGTRSSISGYATRSSISGYGTRSSTSGYSGKLSSSKWA